MSCVYLFSFFFFFFFAPAFFGLSFSSFYTRIRVSFTHTCVCVCFFFFVLLQVVQVRDPHRGVMVTTSLGVILFTTVFFGAVMPFFTRGLKPERGVHVASMFNYRER